MAVQRLATQCLARHCMAGRREVQGQGPGGWPRTTERLGRKADVTCLNGRLPRHLPKHTSIAHITLVATLMQILLPPWAAWSALVRIVSPFVAYTAYLTPLARFTHFSHLPLPMYLHYADQVDQRMKKIRKIMRINRLRWSAFGRGMRTMRGQCGPGIFCDLRALALIGKDSGRNQRRRLLAVRGRVIAAQIQQLRVGPPLHHAAGFQYHDQIGATNRRHLVRNNHTRSPR